MYAVRVRVPLSASRIATIPKYMDFEIITPNNGCDDEVNLNYMNASKIVAIHVCNENEVYT